MDSPDLAWTAPCDFCSKPQQRQTSTEVQLTDNVQGTHRITMYTMHSPCCKFLECWTDIHRIPERIGAAGQEANGELDATTLYSTVVFPALSWMFELLTKPKSNMHPKKHGGGCACSALEQDVRNFFFAE